MSSSEGVSLPQLALSSSLWRTQLDRAWQHLLFMIPYASAIMTGLTLHLLTMNDQQNVFLNNNQDTPNSASDTTIADEGVVDEFSTSSTTSTITTDATTTTTIPFVLDTTRRTPYIKFVWLGGFIQLMMVGTYLTSGMNNHTFKVYSTIWHALLTMVLTVGMIHMKYHHDGDLDNTEEEEDFTVKRILLVMKQALLIECLLYWFPNMFYMFWIHHVPSINEVITQKLYIGNAKAATSSTLLKKNGITHILELYQGNLNRANDAYRVPYHVRLLQLECSDTLDSKRSILQIGEEAISFIHDAIGDDHPSDKASNARVLVHCSAGVSRSPAMVCHYLLSTMTSSESSNSLKKKKQRQKANNNTHKSPMDIIYQQLRTIRPLADVSIAHMKELRQYHSETNHQKSIQTDNQQTSKAIVGNPKRKSKATKDKKNT